MTEEKTDGGIYVDSDWKQEAAREKERLAEQEKKGAESQPQTGPDGQPIGPPSFFDLVNLLAMQAAIGLGGYQGPNGESLPANPAAAKHHIDLLEVLVEKTKGNLTDEEKRALDGVTHELRMHFVSAVTHPGANAPQDKDQDKTQS